MTRILTKAERLINTRDTVGESPVWCPATERLWWTDIDGSRIHALAWSHRKLQTWQVQEPTGCIALHAQGGLIAGMTTGIFHLQLTEAGNVTQRLLYRANHQQENMRFNDGRTDRQGRFWSTTMVKGMALAAPAGQVYLTQHDQTRTILDGFITPNGTAFSPDGRTMYISDSHPSVRKVWSMQLDEDGTPINRKVFIDMRDYPGRPDGAAVDEDGCYWICGNDAGLVHRFTPDGRLDYSISVPVDKPAMCTFAGPGLDTLVITTIRPVQVPAGQEDLAGAVFAAMPGVKGLAETPYSG